MKKEPLLITKENLMKALKNTYEDSRFLISRRLDETGDFFNLL